MRDLSKFKGCLIGGAVGDALGYAVEFLPAGSIFKKYGENGITEYELRHGVEYFDFYLVTAYVPTGTGGKKSEAIQKKLVWLNDFVEYIKALNQKKPVILCGDMNIAHNEIDLSYPDHKSAGFTDEERAVITDILDSGFCESFRYLHPNAETQYTWVSNRFKTGGLRLDYFFVSNVLNPKIIKADILREKVPTDHYPILLELEMEQL